MSAQEEIYSVRSRIYRLVNFLGRRFADRVSLTEEDLLKKARGLTGLSDWGGDEFRAPLSALLGSYETDARLNFLGRLSTRRELIHRLANRLRIREDLRRHPEILKTPIRRPLFITGLPRTGTTFLHRLLALDTACRSLQLWELLEPSPPPESRTYESDSRRKRLGLWFFLRTRLFFSRRGRLQARAIHNTRYDAPEECWPLFQNGFLADIFSLQSRLISYNEWLREREMAGAYEYYRRQLQLLLWRCPADRLVLKSPAHLNHLDALFHVFPDARVVWMHRDPIKTIPSLCSLVTFARATRSDNVDHHEIGRFILDYAERSIDSALCVREGADPARFCDIDYYDMLKDPIRIVRKIYAHMGDNLSIEAERRMKRWLDGNHKGRYGDHSYGLGDFGLDAGEIECRFETYCKRFSIPREQG